MSQTQHNNVTTAIPALSPSHTYQYPNLPSLANKISRSTGPILPIPNHPAPTAKNPSNSSSDPPSSSTPSRTSAPAAPAAAAAAAATNSTASVAQHTPSAALALPCGCRYSTVPRPLPSTSRDAGTVPAKSHLYTLAWTQWAVRPRERASAEWPSKRLRVWTSGRLAVLVPVVVAVLVPVVAVVKRPAAAAAAAALSTAASMALSRRASERFLNAGLESEQLERAQWVPPRRCGATSASRARSKYSACLAAEASSAVVSAGKRETWMWVAHCADGFSRKCAWMTSKMAVSSSRQGEVRL
ncbi:hypothetical protein VTK26DRAFT_3377 [Humicola hyalothermophila]